MKKTPLFTSTLIAAATAFSFSALPAWADTTYLPNSTSGTSFDLGGSSEIASGDYAIASGAEQGWFIPWVTTGGAGSYSLSFGSGTTFSGTGLIGIFFNQGSGDGAESVDLTNVDATNFSGQLIVVNNWNNETDVKLLGESWANVEYVFANAVDDTTLAAKYGLTGITRGDLNSDFASKGLNDYLALQGNTTLAGVTGASKGVTVTDSTGATEVLCEHEFITVTEAGQILTLVGEGNYEFYGTVGAEGLELSISMGYDSSSGSGDSDGKVGSQTFGGTNYLQDVKVNEGTLKLGGTTSIKGAVSVAADAELDLSGKVALSSAIQNSGTVVIDSDVVFVLDSLTGTTDSDKTTYTIISGGTITGWDGSNLDYTSFTIEGTTLTSSRQIDLSVSGQVTIDTNATAENLTWAGTSSGGNTWTRDTSVTNWTNSSNSTDYFANGDSVTFGAISGNISSTVNISGSLLAGTITVSDNYTFVFADGIKVEAQYVDVASGKTLTLQLAGGASSAEFHMDSETFYQFFLGTSENHGNVVIGSGVTFYLSNIGNDSASFYSSNTGVSITGTGTLSVAANSGYGIGLYLPGFEGTVEFRSGNARFGVSNSNETGIYNSNATLKFDDGAGIALVGSTSSAVTAKLVFEAGSHTIDSGTATGEFSGAIDAADATLTKTGTGTITFSGGGSIGTLTANAGSVIFSGESKTYTIDTITKSGNNNAGTLEVASGTTVNAGTLNASWHIGTIQVDGELNISDSIVIGSGSQEIFTGTGTVTVGTLQVGHSDGSNPGSIKVDGGLTLIADSVTKGNSTISYIELGNATIGTSNLSSLTFSDATSFTLSATEGSTTFNTNVYNVETGAFTTTGTTITISVNVVGEGNIAVTGNGTLALTGSSSALGSVTVDSGATLSLSGTVSLASGSSSTISGSVTLGESGKLSVASNATITLNTTLGTTNTGTVVFADGAKLILTDEFLSSASATDESIAIIVANTITFGGTPLDTQTSDALATLLAEYVSYSDSYQLTWSYSSGTLYAIVAMPEPSMFGLMFGLGALALTATRRRRRR